jgi:hypothetical protein
VKKSLFLTTPASTTLQTEEKDDLMIYEPVTVKEDDDIDIKAVNLFRLNSRNSLATAVKAPRNKTGTSFSKGMKQKLTS